MTPHDQMRWYAARRDLAAAMHRLSNEVRQSHNKKQARLMSITGASYLSSSIKDRIAAAKARSAEISSGTDAALAKFHSAADAAERVAKTIEAEANTLLSEIGQFSNGAPPDDPEPAPATATSPPPATATPLPPLTYPSAAEPKKNEGSF